MAFVEIPNGVLVEVRWTCEGSKCENTFCVDMLETPSIGNMASLGTVVLGWVNDTYLPMLSENIFCTEVLLTDATLEEGLQQTIPVGVAGSVATEQMANEMSFCVSLRTGSRGRSKRGRWFMPPPLLTDRAGPNNVSTTYLNAAVAALQTLMDAIDTAGFAMSVASRQIDGVKLTVAVVTRYIAAIAVDSLLDSQRQRKPGNGS